MSDLIEREEWLIRKGGFFYRQNCQGYTTTKAEAGRYTKAKAEKEAAVEPWHMKAVHQDDVSPDSLSARVEFYEQKLAYAADRIAALEAEASERERRGLERAAEVADQHYRNRQRSWKESRVDLEGFRSLEAKDIAAAIRALIPEAPAQPELASAAANQISTPEVGEPAPEGNPEDHPRYPALLADAKARVRNENLDGSPRRHAVVREGE